MNGDKNSNKNNIESETLTLCQFNKSKARAVEQTFLRCYCDIRRNDWFRYEVVQNLYNVEDNINERIG